MIIDCHGHIASTKILPEVFFDGWAENMQRKLGMDGIPTQRVHEMLLGMLGDDNCNELVEEMDSAGIDKTILLVIDFGFAFPEIDFDIEKVHLIHKKIMDNTGRFIKFSGVDPRRGQGGLDLFERAIRDWGFSGLKIYPPCGYTPSNKELFPFYEICRQYKVPVLTHIGPTSERLSFKYSMPIDVDLAAQQFHDVDFILAHTSVMWPESAAMLAEFRSNVYLDMSGFQSGLHNKQFQKSLKMHLEHGLHHKLLFGIDWPIHRFFGSQKTWLSTFKEICGDCGLTSDDEMEMILHRNIQYLLDKKVSVAA